jgi:large subunit ribosomal protein L15
MLDYQITSIVGSHKNRKRVGRGTGSGRGKTCGRGHKGSGSRAGATSRSLYEGGQMPLVRRVPKRGFSNYKFARRYEIVNLIQLEDFDDGSVIGVERLLEAGLVDSADSRVKILGKGDLTKRLEVSAHRFSKAAEQKIVACGGTAKLIK